MTNGKIQIQDEIANNVISDEQIQVSLSLTLNNLSYFFYVKLSKTMITLELFFFTFRTFQLTV